jgi:hypothetical protein
MRGPGIFVGRGFSRDIEFRAKRLPFALPHPRKPPVFSFTKSGYPLLPINIPTANTTEPPTITWTMDDRSGVSIYRCRT